MRRWRWALLGLLIAGVALVNLTPRSGEAQAARALRKLGAEITRDDARPGKPVVAVNLAGSEIKPDDLDLLHALPHLERLDLSSAPVTDEGLAHLSALSGLRVLNLSRTDVTDAGLAHLKELSNLEELRLGRTAITDKGLPHLHGLAKLGLVSLYRTGVTVAGIARLRKALPRCRIELQ